jgi:YVTN family beta-propeller protein
VKSIKTDNGVENLLYNGEYLFAASNNFGMTDTLTVIDPSSNSVVKEIKLSYGPAGMVVDANNDLWIVTAGSYMGNDGKVFKIDTETLTVTKEFGFTMNLGSDLCLTSDKMNVLYHSGNSVYKISIDATEAPANPIFEAELTEPYSLSLDPSNDDVYFGDALDYQSPGNVYVYSQEGVLSHTIAAGINPTQVVFK